MSSTETIPDSLREIFITEDDTFSDISYESLSTEEAPELRGQTMQIVGHEAVKLSSENPTTFHEKVAMYSANQTNSEGYDSESCYSELTDEQDADLSEDQFRYLQSNLTEGFTGKDAQACYESIKNLKKAYQLNAFKLGLSPEDAQKIDQRTSEYLAALENSDPSPELVRETYEKIISLNGHQAESFQLGLDHEKAANITLEQFNATLEQVNAGDKDKIISLPKSGESQELLDRRTFLSCYQMVTMVVPSPSPHQDLTSSQPDTNKRSGDPLINTISAKRNCP